MTTQRVAQGDEAMAVRDGVRLILMFEHRLDWMRTGGRTDSDPEEFVWGRKHRSVTGRDFIHLRFFLVFPSTSGLKTSVCLQPVQDVYG